jgi:uncharacterized protein YcbX
MSVSVRLTAISIYPIKSCGGFDFDDALLTSHGFEWDREWMLVDPLGQFLTQRNHPRMALIATELSSKFLTVRAPGMQALQIPLESNPDAPRISATVWSHTTSARSEGQEADAWFSAFLNSPASLVRWDPDQRRLSPSDWTQGIEAEARFADAFPYLMISEATLEDLNRRIPGGGALLVNRFRPNLVVSGCDAGAEDVLTEVCAAAAGVHFRAVKPCTRCSITNTDQSTADVGLEPLKTLAGYRQDARFKAPILGQNLILLKGAGIRLKRGECFELSRPGNSD